MYFKNQIVLKYTETRQQAKYCIQKGFDWLKADVFLH